MKKQVKLFSFILIAVILTAFTLISVGAAGSTTYQIKYYGNGGGTDVHYQTATRNKSVELLENPYERTGYTFKGWATSSSGQVAYSEGQDVINVTRPGRSINLYAVWKVNTYTVCYNSNGGTGRMASGTGTFGSPLKLTANAFTFTGGTFGGWNAHNSAGEWVYSSDGTSDGEFGFYAEGAQPAGWSLCTYLDGQSVTNLNVENNDTITFVAIWVTEDAPTYTVIFNANTGSGTMDSQTVTQNLPTALTANTFTLKGHKFAGWATSADGDVVYADQDSVMLTTNLTLYAVWTPNQYIIRYDANGGDGTMEDTIVTYGVSTALSEPTFTMKGHHVSGWYRYRSNDNKWYYTSADGSTSEWYVEGTEPEGYTKNVINTTSSVSKTSPVDGDIVIVYAVWEVNTFTVRYDANGGSGTMEDTVVTWGVSTSTRKNTFTRSGYTFTGWYVERQSDGKWGYSANDGADSSVKFYTKGSQPDGWGLHPYSNGGTLSKTSSVNGDVCFFHAIWEKAPTQYVTYSGSSSYKSGKYYTALTKVVVTGDPRIDIVNIAKSQIGYQESGSSSQLSGTVQGSGNYTEYGKWYGLQDMWCAMFVSWCSNVAGVSTSVVPKTCSTVTGLNKFIDWGNAYTRKQVANGTYVPQPGDIIYFKSDRNDAITNHTGIVTGYTGTTIYTIEGNTSSATISTNGGAVCAKSYDISNTYIVYVCSPKYKSSDVVAPTASYPTLKEGSSGYRVKALQYILNYHGASLTVDGDFGSATTTAVKTFQTDNGLTVSGTVDSATWKKLCSVKQSTSSYDTNLTKAIQVLLNSKDSAGLTVDGIFGSGTKAAVVLFQASKGLSTTGTVSSTTWKFLLG